MRTPPFSYAVLPFALAALAALPMAGGCSSTTIEAPADAGADRSTRDVATPPDAADDTATPTHDECFAACDAAHPNSVAKNTAIDTCWESACKAPCVDGTPFDAGSPADAGDAAPDAAVPACTNQVDTGDVACDLCTKMRCCAPWDGCFDDADCSALVDCESMCPQ